VRSLLDVIGRRSVSRRDHNRQCVSGIHLPWYAMRCGRRIINEGQLGGVTPM